MAEVKPGARLKSTVCDTEIVVIAAPGADEVITCGGAAMSAEGEAAITGTLDAEAAAGTELGKRYTNAAGSIELLCVKPGAGSLAVAGEQLVLKGAKPLPSSD